VILLEEILTWAVHILAFVIPHVADPASDGPLGGVWADDGLAICEEGSDLPHLHQSPVVLAVEVKGW
jgi:hypothetical protein